MAKQRWPWLPAVDRRRALRHWQPANGRQKPVKDCLRTTWFDVSSPPIVFGSPITTLNTPAGMPARSASTVIAKAENGVASAAITFHFALLSAYRPTLHFYRPVSLCILAL